MKSLCIALTKKKTSENNGVEALLADRDALRGALDDRRLTSSADEPLWLDSRQPDDDLSYLVECNGVVTADLLSRLGKSELEQMMRELYGALKEAVPDQDARVPAETSRPSPVDMLASARAELRRAADADPLLPTKGRTSPIVSVDERPIPALPWLRASARPPGTEREPRLFSEELELTVLAPEDGEQSLPPRHKPAKIAGALAAGMMVLLCPIGIVRAPPTIPEIAVARSAQGTETAVSQLPLQERGGAQLGSVAGAESTLTAPPPASSPAPELRPANGLLGPKDIESLIEQGDRFVLARDISAARSYYERAIAAGSGPAAFALGRTFDPIFLAQIGAKGVRPDPERAAAWYRVAADAATRRTGTSAGPRNAAPR